MKTFRCWEEIATPLNLWGAWRDFERNKRRRPDVAAFSLDAERHVLRLAEAIRTGRYQPGPLRLLRIVDPKRRLISAARVPDRVVHHALHRVLAPLLNRRFIDHSYACLPERGSHRAILQFQRSMRRYRHVLKLDISRYFYSIDRERLRSLLYARLPEPPLQALLHRVLERGAGIYQRRDVVDWLGWEASTPPGCGLPIGNLTSQWWGNLYLDGLDHHATRALRARGYQRYMDDITLFSDDPALLLAQRDQIASWLDAERGLRLKEPDATPTPTSRPTLYLGYRITRDDIRLGPKARGRLRRHIRRNHKDPERAAAVVRSFAAAWMFAT